MKRNSIFLLLFMALIGASCQKEVKFKDDLLAPKLVVQGLLEIDSACVIYLERTSNFMETNPDVEITSGATLTIENLTAGTSYTISSPVDSNRYEFPFTVAPHTTYKITVTHADYPTVTATTTTTEIVPFLSIDTVTTLTEDYEQLETTWKWQDPPGENYYMVRTVMSLEDTVFHYTNFSGGMSSNDPIADDGSDDPLNDYNGGIYFVFPDETFESQIKTFIGFSPNPFTFPSQNSIPKVQYTLSSINRETYLYYKSAQQQMHSDPTFSEPVKVYTNVENGYGIFGCASHKILILE